MVQPAETTPLVWLSLHRDVSVLRWPTDALDDPDGACLWVVDEQDEPPALQSCMQDWVWASSSDQEVRTRLTALAARAAAHPRRPSVDDVGMLTFAGRSLFLSPTDARLMHTLAEHFEEVVEEPVLLEEVWPDGGSPVTLRTHISRVRRRLRPVGLAIRCVRSTGYQLTTIEQASH